MQMKEEEQKRREVIGTVVQVISFTVQIAANSSRAHAYTEPSSRFYSIQIKHSLAIFNHFVPAQQQARIPPVPCFEHRLFGYRCSNYYNYDP